MVMRTNWAVVGAGGGAEVGVPCHRDVLVCGPPSSPEKASGENIFVLIFQATYHICKCSSFDFEITCGMHFMLFQRSGLSNCRPVTLGYSLFVTFSVCRSVNTETHERIDRAYYTQRSLWLFVRGVVVVIYYCL